VTVTRAQVVAALAELRANRPRLAADRMIRGYLQRFGNGASSIGELDPAYYESVWRSAGGTISAEDFYGVALDVRPVVEIDQSKAEIKQPAKPPTPPASTRPRTPMTIQLEALLAARVGIPRSKPTYTVNTGNASHSEDQDDSAVQDFPAGSKMS
jgi:hypothetical protein